MKELLLIYANTEPLMRQSVKDLLNCFRNNLPEYQVYYHNAIFNRAPALNRFREVDYILFHHSVTTVWNRKVYSAKVDSWEEYNYFSAYKIALMQDEYKNIDLLRSFIERLSIDAVYTLAPPSLWRLLYGEKFVKTGVLNQYLAGYVVRKNDFNSLNETTRFLDIGYRADWSKMHVKLGNVGLFKRDIANAVKYSAKKYNLHTDIELGPKYFFNGEGWPKFLQRCRYVIGAPSGSSVLDDCGEIEKHLSQLLRENPSATEEYLYLHAVANFEGSLSLEVISPRHFEAMANGCGLILIESDYNGILLPWVHYLPIKRDYSNVDEIISLVSDEEYRLKMVRNCYEDFVYSEKYSYKSFARMVFPKQSFHNDKTPKKLILGLINNLVEFLKRLFCFVYYAVSLVLKTLKYYRNPPNK